MRQLKFHEKKLLKKVDFLQWKNEHNQRELQVEGLSDPCWKALLQTAILVFTTEDISIEGVGGRR